MKAVFLLALLESAPDSEELLMEQVLASVALVSVLHGKVIRIIWQDLAAAVTKAKAHWMPSKQLWLHW